MFVSSGELWDNWEGEDVLYLYLFPSDSPPTPRTVRDKPTLRQSLLTFLISPARLELSTVIQILKELDNLKKEHIQLIREKVTGFPLIDVSNLQINNKGSHIDTYLYDIKKLHKSIA